MTPENSYCPIAARDGHGKHPRCRCCRFAVLALCAILAVSLTGCGQSLAGTTYRASLGRQVTEFWQDRANTTWNVGAEFRFDVRR